MADSPSPSRRGFLLGAASGLLVGAPLGWHALRGSQWLEQQRPRSVEVERPALGMPGRFPGRVVEVRHPAAVRPDHTIDGDVVQSMIERGMCGLIGAPEPKEAWRRLFVRDDVVAIKVNPVGRRALPGEGGRVPGAIGSISSPEVLVEVVRCLHEYCDIPKQNIIVFERYAEEFRQTGYDVLLRTRPMEGVRWCASSVRYENDQVEIDGQLRGQPRDPNVVGYDPDVFVSMGFCSQDHNPRDDRRLRSHLSMVVTRMASKIITIPCLKDHKSAGVTLSLKNMSHGMNNNVARSHVSGVYRFGGTNSNPNQCNTFIPTAVAQRPLIEKATLHLLDGLIGVYEGGPGSWNRSWGTWARKSLFFSTDPVALDHVGWDIIDAQRAERGLLPVAQMGVLQGTPSVQFTPRMAALAALSTPQAALALLLDQQQRQGNLTEQFDRRQPEHIALAGLMGLGRFDAVDIDHRVHRMA